MRMAGKETREFDPGDSRVEAELNHALIDAEAGDWDEAFQEVTSEVAREVSDAMGSMSLNDEQKERYRDKLSELRRIVTEAQDIPKDDDPKLDRQTVMLDTINELIIKLS